MDKIKRISENEFSDIASRYPFNRLMLTKDYFITVLLFLLKDTKGIYFKGGTALQKCFLNHTRLSEDIDFDLTKPINNIKKEIEKIITESKIFDSISYDKGVDKFRRMVVHYTGFSGEKGSVFIDLNQRSKIILPPKKYVVKKFFPSIPDFTIFCLSEEELFAGKVSAAIGRNKPRDYFDIYMILKNGYKINWNLVKIKCKNSNQDFDKEKIFLKAKKLYNLWDSDLIPLLLEPIEYKEVLTFLPKVLDLKSIKESKKKF